MAEQDIDWLAVEADYRPNKLSLRAIGEKHGCTEGAIRKRAKKEGWVRDFIHISNGKKVVLDKSIQDKYNKSGFVYVIYLDDTSESRFYKIGMSSNFNNRLDTHQGSSPFNICVACAYYVGNMREEERALHLMFEDKRIRGEWFDLNATDLSIIASRSLLV